MQTLSALRYLLYMSHTVCQRQKTCPPHIVCMRQRICSLLFAISVKGIDKPTRKDDIRPGAVALKWLWRPELTAFIGRGKIAPKEGKHRYWFLYWTRKVSPSFVKLQYKIERKRRTVHSVVNREKLKKVADTFYKLLKGSIWHIYQVCIT